MSYAPQDWQQRVVEFSSPATDGAIGLCMERHDLALAKLCAGRLKDLEFVRGLVQANLLDAAVLRERLYWVTAPTEVIESAARHLAALFAKA